MKWTAFTCVSLSLTPLASHLIFYEQLWKKAERNAVAWGVLGWFRLDWTHDGYSTNINVWVLSAAVACSLIRVESYLHVCNRDIWLWDWWIETHTALWICDPYALSAASPFTTCRYINTWRAETLAVILRSAFVPFVGKWRILRGAYKCYFK